jgi:putative transcriptional regulator
VIEIRIDGLLGKRGRTFYWLAKATGVSHTTLWRLKKGRSRGINFETLEKLCRALACQPGDVMRLAVEGKRPRPSAVGPAGSARAAKSGRAGATKGVR